MSKNPFKPTLFGWIPPKIHLWVILLVGFVCYVNTLKNDFAVDDMNVITENDFTKAGIKGIADIFRYDSYAGNRADTINTVKRYYRPLSIATFALERSLFYPKLKPHEQPSAFSGHLINLLIFLAILWVIYKLLALYISPHQPTITLLTGLLFAVWPVHVEAVANVKGRDELLSLWFALLALWFIFKSTVANATKNMVLAAIFLFLGLLSKENSITFLAVIPLSLGLFTNIQLKPIVKLTVVMIVPVMIYVVIRGAVLGWDFSYPEQTDPLNDRYAGQSNEVRIASSIAALLYYWKLLFYPPGFSWDHGIAVLPYLTFVDWQVWLSLLFNAGILAGAIFLILKKTRLLQLIGYGISFFYITFSIYSNLFINIGGFIGERFLFTPSLGIILALSGGLVWVAQKHEFLNFGAKIVVKLLVMLFIGATMLRNSFWKDNYTLFMHDVEIQPQSAKANGAAGGALISKAVAERDTLQKRQLLTRAIGYSKRALTIYPKFVPPLLDLGMAHFLLKNIDSAKYYVKVAAALEPNHNVVRNHSHVLAGYFIEQSNQAIKAGQVDKSIFAIEQALEFVPKDAELWMNLGLAYYQQKNYIKAIPAFEQAVRLQPFNARFWDTAGSGYYAVSNYAAAKNAWENALKNRSANTTLPNAENGLVALKKMGY